MTTRIRLPTFLALLLLLTPLLAGDAAHAQSLLTNGTFETGTLTGWTVAAPRLGDAYDDDGDPDMPAPAPAADFFAASGTTAPLSGLETLGAKDGAFFALSDMNANSALVIGQSFTAVGATTRLSWDMYVYDWFGASAFDAAAGLDPATANVNQAARVDLLFASTVAGGGSAFYTTAAGDIAATLYGPGADASSQGADPTVPAYTRYSVNVSTNVGQTYFLRFATVNNRAPISLAFDNVAAETVPEPASGALAASAALSLLLAARRRRSTRTH